MKQMAKDRSFHSVYLPIRPVSKVKHQKMDIAEYMALKDENGLMFDRWVRTHLEAGVVVIKPARESDHLVGTVAVWESWLPGEKFPVSGEYYVTDRKHSMIAPLIVDVENDICTYIEPNVWSKYVV